MEHTDKIDGSFDPHSITRPAPVLLKYYFLTSLFAGPLFPFAFIPMYFKYETLRYRFDKDGISMAWGILFRREIHLTYRRIQDIHLNRNIVQRWLGLATVAVQTASGSARPEMSIEGILQTEPLRDYLYSEMRGAKDDSAQNNSEQNNGEDSVDENRVARLLDEIRDVLKNAVERERSDA